MSDEFEGHSEEEKQEFADWIRIVKKDLVPKIYRSHMVASVACSPDDIDPKFCLELGISIMLNKPIIAVIKPGMEIPEKFAKVVDHFVELNMDNPEGLQEGINDAVNQILKDMP